MRMRSLDGEHDWNFGRGLQSYNFDQNALAENIQTRLMEFINDCFFNMRAGLPWQHLLGDRNTKAELEADCQAVILNSSGVVKIVSFSSVITSSRSCTISAVISTIYSQNYTINTEVTV